ncbi:MAG: efflux RND transporter periplasmic adaptor subunit, partial [Bacteroidales bacterium]
MCALLLVIVSCSSKKEVNEFISPVFYEKVGLTSDSKTFSFPGVIQSSQEPRLSFRVAGTIESIKVELGDTLKKGAVIATLDRSDYAVNYNKSVSALKGAEASFIAAKAAFARAEKLYVNGNLSLSDCEKAKLQFESAQSMKTSTLFMVEAAKNQLDYTFLRAPFSGVVTSLFIKEREIAAPGVPIIV